MKRPLLLSLTLAVLAANAYALPAREQAAPQAQASHAAASQVLNTLASDGSDHTYIGKQSETLGENGSDRTPLGQALASDGSDHTYTGKQSETLGENGSDRTPLGQSLASDGSDHTYTGKSGEVAEGGRARLEEKGLASDGGDRVIDRNKIVS